MAKLLVRPWAPHGRSGRHLRTAHHGRNQDVSKKRKLAQDGVVGPLTYAAALQSGFDPGLSDPLGGTSGPDWPPRPAFAPLISNAEREKIFGKFEYERIAPARDDIRILGQWESQNIVTISLPQLIGVKGAPASGRVRVHKLVTGQFKSLFESWERDGLLPLLKTWDGSFVPRFVRGNAQTLSNHSWGTAFDINYQWNLLGHLPALRGQPGRSRAGPRRASIRFLLGWPLLPPRRYAFRSRARARLTEGDMPEFVFVSYARVRDVFIDGRRSGQTNELLTVGEGERKFTLGEPVDYKPSRQVVVVTGTTDNAPTQIDFEPKA